jgi:pyochelin biosynthetic protein PchC
MSRSVLRRLHPGVPPPGRSYPIVCFPHAGGAASAFRLLARHAWDLEIWAVQYPGREDRFNDPHPGSIAALATEAIAALEEELHDDRMLSYALLGASQGSVVALEVARRALGGGTPPDALVVVGSRAPSAYRDSLVVPTSDSATLSLLLEASPGLEGILADPDSRDHYLGVLRQDLEARNRYSLPRPERLPIPVLVLRGQRDPIISQQVAAESWQAWSDRRVMSATVAGGHLPHTDPEGARAVVAFLREHVRPGGAKEDRRG